MKYYYKFKIHLQVFCIALLLGLLLVLYAYFNVTALFKATA
jgi:hypothetical protein